AYVRSGRSEALDVAVETLDAMANGGLYDQVGGGFHRYATDPEWTVPHFEKMLYDNAELPKAYLGGYQVTGECRYARIAQETFAFVERELRHPDGGFYSTLDARSEGEEGRFYVWTPEQVREALGGVDADLFCDYYGVRSGGNFEGGRTVLTVATGIAELAEEYDLEATEVRRRLMEARVSAFEARGSRTRPDRDE
ncbi:thioredoxin domain-containing protein, partial [Halobium palmae]